MPSKLMPSSHQDTFTRENLPPLQEWPVFLFNRPELQYPEQMNCAVELLDVHVAQGHGERVAIQGMDAGGPVVWTYRQLQSHVNQIAHVLKEDMGLVSGQRLLLRGGTSPMMARAKVDLPQPDSPTTPRVSPS